MLKMMMIITSEAVRGENNKCGDGDDDDDYDDDDDDDDDDDEG